MLDETTLRAMISGGETSTVEFKLKPPRPAEVAERICGMANTRTGGVILFGIADESGDIIGVPSPNQAVDIILRAARMIKPAVTLEGTGPEEHTLEGKTVIVVRVPPNNGTIYQSSGVFWMRRGSYTTPMSIEELSSHLHGSGALQWELNLCPHAVLDDLDPALLERYLELRTEPSLQRLRHTPREDVLLGMKCVARDPNDGVLRPTNVGMLLFGRSPQFHIPYSEVVCVRYDDDLGAGKYSDRKILRGTLPELIDQAADFGSHAEVVIPRLRRCCAL